MFEITRAVTKIATISGYQLKALFFKCASFI